MGVHRPQQKIPSSSACASASKRKRSRVGGAKDRAESPHVNHTPIRSGRSPGSAVAGNRWKETGFVFTTTVGTPLDGPTVSRQFRRLLEKAGFRPMRFHDLRHVSASLLLSQGTHPPMVMEMLGHSTISVTMNTYSHVIPSLRNEFADQMDAAFAPVATQVATLHPLPRGEAAPN